MYEKRTYTELNENGLHIVVLYYAKCILIAF